MWSGVVNFRLMHLYSWERDLSAVEQVASAVEQVASAVEQVASAVEQVASAVEQVASAVEQVASVSPETVWTSWCRAKSLVSTGNRTTFPRLQAFSTAI